MKNTKAVTWETRDGRNIEVGITKTRGVQDKIANLDGDVVTLGKETVDALEITLSVNGKFITRAYNAPNIVTRDFYRTSYDKIKASGGYARLGDVYIGEEHYNMVMGALDELEAEVSGDGEFAEVKAQEEVKEAQVQAGMKAASEYEAKMRKSGLCPKCNTWCYGDCGAN